MIFFRETGVLNECCAFVVPCKGNLFGALSVYERVKCRNSSTSTSTTAALEGLQQQWQKNARRRSP